MQIKNRGTADIIGFGLNGVFVLRNSCRVQAVQVLNDFGYNTGGWHVDKHVRLVADMTGDGTADIVGFSHAGVNIAVNNGDNTWSPRTLVLPHFGYIAGGWRIGRHVRYVADLRRSGRADIIGLADAGVNISQNNGQGNFSPPTLVLAAYGYDQGWRSDKHLRFLADTTGNGLPDIIGFGEAQVSVSFNNGNGTFQPAKALFSGLTIGSGGWEINKHPRTIADLTGDGRADIIGFGDDGVSVAFNNGDGTFQPSKLVLGSFGYSAAAGSWRVEQHPRFVADLTGDGRGDIVGFASAGVYVSFNNGDGTFRPPVLVINSFGTSAGEWLVERHPRFLADMTGNGAADIVGFGEDAVYVSYNDGKGNFGPPVHLTDAFTPKDGEWAMDKTVRWVTNLY